MSFTEHVLPEKSLLDVENQRSFDEKTIPIAPLHENTTSKILSNFKKIFIFTQYPYAVWFIIGNEFCERFSFYGFKTILSLYLHNFLQFSEDEATACVHAFIFLAYFTPIFGGWLSDSVLGK